MADINRRGICHDCGALEGELHEYGCDMERCPFCGGQLITCDCAYEKLGLVDKEKYPRTNGLSPWIYENGLTDEQREHWISLLKAKGPLPYICWPNICARCGELWPELFMVPDKEWQAVVGRWERDALLCRSCYDLLKDWVIESVEWTDK